MSIEYIINIVYLLIKDDTEAYSICIINAFGYFCFLASCFWLNVMSFHVGWTFNLLQRKQQEKRQLVFYAIVVWGLSLTFAIIPVLIEVYEYPKFLPPRFREGNCWFYELKASFSYMYALKTICIMNSICFSLCTVETVSEAIYPAVYYDDSKMVLIDLAR
ncbi:probable G-protein coupled receptor Mth-like 1 isoform X2 [Cataglyphis hispanica]|uniref:probable G-protein coupled receptor Mth-like 1 isoform X2 n=1 Tax=Cataglyphis hispanica TaxID=1086592 RepID=UPI0021808CD8|nr:probable G-protein coupled receptor Mth-like 1 isoform X2 [Cataglyphis hispanica]